HEPPRPRLACAVRRDVQAEPDPAGIRRDGDDAAPSPLAHPAHGGVGAVEDSEEVQVDEQVPQPGVAVLERHTRHTGSGDTRVVDEDVDGTELAGGGGEAGEDGVAIGDVEGSGDSTAAGGADGVRRLPGAVADEVVDGHGRALAR